MLQAIVVSGLPGSGKSTVSEAIAQTLSLPIFSIDPIEAAMWRSGIPKNTTGIATYEVAAALANEQLKLGLSLVIDAVNPVEAARESWRELARANKAHLILIEVICSDQQLHKKRIEDRMRNIEGMSEITWERVIERKREYESWVDKHLTLDSVAPSEVLVKKAIEYIQHFSA